MGGRTSHVPARRVALRAAAAVALQSGLALSAGGFATAARAQEYPKAAPDGYTVLFTVSSHSINQALYPSLPFDTERDLRGVCLIAALTQVLVVHPSVPASNLQEWLAIGRKEPRCRQYGTGGVGSPGHFAGGLLQSMSKTPLEHIPYRGAGPAMADTMGNQVGAALVTSSGAIGHIRNGRLKAIAVTSPQRSAQLTEVATIAESGVPGYESDTWIGTSLASPELARRVKAMRAR